MKRFIAIILFCIAALSAFAEPRNALLIANGQYQKFSKLANPVSEAKELAKSLQELGFDVNLVENASFETMNIEIKKFRDKLKTDKGIGFFHYGGHAVQVQGENYLIPVNADIPNEDYVPSRTVNVSEVMNSMLADTNIIILDSCRDNPFVGSGRSASRGLQSVKFKPKNSVIVYSAEAGKTATDGVFTPILTQKIKENQDLLYVLRDVRNEVYNRTGGEQTPGEYNQLMTAVNLCVGIPSRLAVVEAENERINKELELLRAKQNSANSKEKQEAEIELRRVEAEAKRKQLELQQVREAEARRAAETKRIEEENAKKNENQKKQEEQFAKMQADNAAKLREIERLKNDQAGLEEMVATANEIKKTIAKITSDFNTAMEKAIYDTKVFYTQKHMEIKISKWETDDEFAERKKNETDKLNKSETADITKIKSDYQKEIDGNTVSLKRQLQEILDKPILVTGNRIKVVYGKYDRNKQRFSVAISDKKSLKQDKYMLYIDVQSDNSEERIIKCQEVEKNIQSGGYVGYMKYNVIYNDKISKYIANLLNGGIKKLSDNTILCNFEKDKYFEKVEYVKKIKKAGFVLVKGGNSCSSFGISDHEVTQAEYRAVTGESPSFFKGDNKPVENVSWYDAIEYCNALSRKEGLRPCYTIDKSRKDPNNTNDWDNIKWTVTWNKNANGYRLPTENEWEWAAKGGKRSKHYTYSGSNSIEDVAWYYGNSGSVTHEVKTKQANELGIYDMSGNVWEWCWDWYADNRPNTKDYAGPLSGRNRVGRGGSWSNNANRCSESSSLRLPPYDRYLIHGFRVVRSAR